MSGTADSCDVGTTRCLGGAGTVLDLFQLTEIENILANLSILQEDVLVDGQVLLLALTLWHVGIAHSLKSTVDGIVTLQPSGVAMRRAALQRDTLNIALQNGELRLYLPRSTCQAMSVKPGVRSAMFLASTRIRSVKAESRASAWGTS